MKNLWPALIILFTVIASGFVVLMIQNAISNPIVVLDDHQSTQQSKPKIVLKTTKSSQTPPVLQKAQGKIVCLDPGHTKTTVGGHANGVSEFVVVFNVVQKLKRELEEKGINVVMTKNNVNDEVSNEERATIANHAKSNLFLRLHCDAGNGSGITFYYPSASGTKGGKTGPSAKVIQSSAKAARLIHDVTISTLSGILQDNGIKTDRQTLIGSQQGALTGSIYAEVPVVLVEMVFLTNKADADWISSDAGQEKMASALASGIENYLNAL